MTNPGASAAKVAKIDAAPIFLGSPVLDALVSVVSELAAELWVVKRHIQVLEGQVVSLGGVPADSLAVDDEAATASAAKAKEFLDRVFRAFGHLGSISESVAGRG